MQKNNPPVKYYCPIIGKTVSLTYTISIIPDGNSLYQAGEKIIGKKCNTQFECKNMKNCEKIN